MFPENANPTSPPVMNTRGSILLMTLILCSFLSVCLLLAADSLLMGNKAQDAFRSSLDLFYLAEAGLAHGRSFCMTHDVQDMLEQSGDAEEGDGEPLSPFHDRIDWGGGSYSLKAYLPADSGERALPVQGASGLLLSVSANLGPDRNKRLLVLLEEPPSCRVLAWWEPQ